MKLTKDKEKQNTFIFYKGATNTWDQEYDFSLDNASEKSTIIDENSERYELESNNEENDEIQPLPNENQSNLNTFH